MKNKEHTANHKHSTQALRRIVECIVSEELDEQMTVAAGLVPGTPPTGLGGNGRSKKANLEEINTIGDVSGSSNGLFDASSTSGDFSVTEDDQDTLNGNKSKKKNKSVSKTVMWMGDGAPGSLPVAKYVALEENATKNPITVKITCEKRPSDKYLQVLQDFIRFCQNKLQIETFPHIFLHVNKKPGMTTGSYERPDNKIHVLVKNRLLVDVLRTISHELTHRYQDESGFLDQELSKVDPMDEMGDLNTPYENEAYEKSGNFVKEFMRIYNGLPKSEVYELNEALVPNSIRHHNSSKPLKKLKSTRRQTVGYKPDGIWYGVGDEWLRWIRSEMPDWEGPFNYNLSIDYSNILQVKTLDELLTFTKQYGVIPKDEDEGTSLKFMAIDWASVAAKYKGIEISPYIFKARFALNWYYGWDVASGCIWDVSAITGVEPIELDENDPEDETKDM